MRQLEWSQVPPNDDGFWWVKYTWHDKVFQEIVLISGDVIRLCGSDIPSYLHQLKEETDSDFKVTSWLGPITTQLWIEL